MKTQYTPHDLIIWLKKSRRKVYSYHNTKCGCLMTQFFRTKSTENLICSDMGDMISRSDLKTKYFEMFPFHGVFWNKVGSNTVTRKKAIEILTAL